MDRTERCYRIDLLLHERGVGSRPVYLEYGDQVEVPPPHALRTKVRAVHLAGTERST